MKFFAKATVSAILFILLAAHSDDSRLIILDPISKDEEALVNKLICLDIPACKSIFDGGFSIRSHPHEIYIKDHGLVRFDCFFYLALSLHTQPNGTVAERKELSNKLHSLMKLLLDNHDKILKSTSIYDPIISQDHLELLKTLVDQGGILNQPDNAGISPLARTVLMEEREMFSLILSALPNNDAIKDFPTNAIQYAAEAKDSHYIELLSKKYSLEKYTDDPPLLFHSRSVAVSKILLSSKGKDLMAVDENKNNVLHHVVKRKSVFSANQKQSKRTLVLIRFYLTKGVQSSAQNKKGQTPFSILNRRLSEYKKVDVEGYRLQKKRLEAVMLLLSPQEGRPTPKITP